MEDTVNEYPDVFNALCKRNFKVNQKAIDSMFEDLCLGHWKKLFESDEEKVQKTEELCDELRGEVYYSSDRMTWDRLLRIHWVWQRIVARLDWGGGGVLMIVLYVILYALIGIVVYGVMEHSTQNVDGSIILVMLVWPLFIAVLVLFGVVRLVLIFGYIIGDALNLEDRFDR